MRRSLLYSLWVSLACWVLPAAPLRADHISGGEISYRLLRVEGTDYTYRVTLKLYKRCGSSRTFNTPTAISIFARADGRRIRDVIAPLTRTETIAITNPDPCISNPPVVCYDIGYYDFDISLFASADGYLLSSQVNFRVNNIVNLVPGYSFVGALYTAEIPGNANDISAPGNTSAQFTGSDLEVICAGQPFQYSFAATDADRDSLRYSFCAAYNSVSGSSPFGVEPTGPPPYQPVPYGGEFNGGQPLGPGVTIDAATGLVSGVAPAAGTYIISVCVEEWRNGRVKATQRKDLQLNVANCGLTTASLLPEYQLCGATNTLTVANQSTSTLIRAYVWRLTTLAGKQVASYSSPVLVHSFTDTGLYRLTLVINPGEACSDSTTSLVRVYPGLQAAYQAGSLCTGRPTRFTNNSSTQYGQLNYWHWQFGDATRNGADSSRLPSPTYAYPQPGTKRVQLVVGNTLGCRDTLVRLLDISNNPSLQLAFTDTLICLGDTLTLRSQASGQLSWSPATAMQGSNTATPRVWPTTTTTYTAQLNDEGCTNTDSVRVRVVPAVSLRPMPDTTICLGDALPLQLQTNALQFSWQPTQGLNNPGLAQPVARPGPGSTTYTVVARIGGCSAQASLQVTTVPYPTAQAGPDTLVCFNTPALLTATTNGQRVQWQPASLVYNASALSTMAKPATTTTFVLQAFDTRGCPKPGVDSITVVVLPAVVATANTDTAVVTGQPLQLQASGGTRYQWQPAAYVSNAGIANPVASFTSPSQGILFTLKAFNEAGCADSVRFTVRVFAGPATVYVPTGFTPNGNGLNEVLRPVLAGVTQLHYFRVYNRYGQLVYSTRTPGHGWDGRINGQPQPGGAYVWALQAQDYTGRLLKQQGTAVLIR